MHHDIKTLDLLVQSIIENKDEDISPILMLYDELAEHTMFKLESKEILKFD